MAIYESGLLNQNDCCMNIVFALCKASLRKLVQRGL